MGERRTGRDQGDGSADKPVTGRRRVSVPEAADVLGLTVEAIRGRIKRGTIEHERDGERVFVLVDTDQPSTSRGPSSDKPDDQPHPADPTRELVEEMRARIDDLREQLDQERQANRENRRIIAGLIERVPELAAASTSGERGARESAAEDELGTYTPPDQTSPQTAARPRSWWRRLIGG